MDIIYDIPDNRKEPKAGMGFLR